MKLTTPFAFAASLAGAIILGACSNGEQPLGLHQRHPHFDALDTDDDGSLSYAEFAKSKWAKDSKSPREVFRKLDTNKNGTISHAELRAYLGRKSDSGR